MRQSDLIGLNKAAIYTALVDRGPLSTLELELDCHLSARTIQEHLRALRTEKKIEKQGRKWAATPAGQHPAPAGPDTP